MLKLKSPAKINLYLRILNKRSDGYHNIVTLFERINLFDDITINVGATRRVAPTIRITCSDPNVPKGPENLAYKAAQALLDYTGKSLSCHITIKKRIPVGGGLAGGSSNAATVLLGLNRLWELKLSKKELMLIGAKIGADVNFFLLGARFAIGKRSGEVTSPLRIKKALWHVLVNPGKGLPTKDIYELWDNMHIWCRETPTPRWPPAKQIGLTQALVDVKILVHSIRDKNLTLLANNLFNDLEGPAQVKESTISEIKGLLRSCGVKAVLMSGSGPTVFGIVPAGKEAVRIKRELIRLRHDLQIFIAKTY